MMSLGSNIKNKRKSLKLSKEYVAEHMQVSRQAVSKWEVGQSNPSTNNLKKLAELFSCDLNELLSPSKDKKEGKVSSIKQNTLLSIAGIILCSILFLVGMLYAEQIPLLVIVGILGLGGMLYSVFQIVTRTMKNQN